MKTKGLQIEDFFKQVRTTVYSLTGGKQTSWEHTSLIGKFCFNAGMLIHSLSVGYPDEAIKYEKWPANSRISQLKEDFLSGSFDKQRGALRKLKQLNPKDYTREEIFLLGRLVMWSAIENCFDCQSYVENANEIADFYTVMKIRSLMECCLRCISTMKVCLSMAMQILITSIPI